MLVFYKKQKKTMANKNVRRRRKLTFLKCVCRQLNSEWLGSSDSGSKPTVMEPLAFFFNSLAVVVNHSLTSIFRHYKYVCLKRST